MVASTGPRAAVRRGEQRVDFRLGEEGDDRSLVAFGRDGQYLLDRRGVIWMMQRRLSAVDDYPQWTGRRIRIPLQGRRLAL